LENLELENEFATQVLKSLRTYVDDKSMAFLATIKQDIQRKGREAPQVSWDRQCWIHSVLFVEVNPG